MSAATKGIVLGAANVVLISIGVAAAEREAGVALLVMMFGGVPGLIVGLLLGLIADSTATARVAVRTLFLIAPAIALVALLALQFHLQSLIVVASIPTIVAALVLERWTRRPVLPPVPVARVAR